MREMKKNKRGQHQVCAAPPILWLTIACMHACLATFIYMYMCCPRSPSIICEETRGWKEMEDIVIRITVGLLGLGGGFCGLMAGNRMPIVSICMHDG